MSRRAASLWPVGVDIIATYATLLPLLGLPDTPSRPFESLIRRHINTSVTRDRAPQLVTG